MHPIEEWWSILSLCLFRMKIREIMPHVERAALQAPLPDLEHSRKQIVELLMRGMAVKSGAGGRNKITPKDPSGRDPPARGRYGAAGEARPFDAEHTRHSGEVGSPRGACPP